MARQRNFHQIWCDEQDKGNLDWTPESFNKTIIMLENTPCYFFTNHCGDFEREYYYLPITPNGGPSQKFDDIDYMYENCYETTPEQRKTLDILYGYSEHLDLNQ